MLLSELRALSILGAVAFLPLTAWAVPAPALPTKAIEIHLEKEVKVGGEQVVLGDVATIYAKNLANFKALSGLVLSRIPEDQAELHLPASYLAARVRAVLPAGEDFALEAPSEIVFKLERLGLSTGDFAGEVLRLGRAAAKIPEGVEAEVVPLTGVDQLKGLQLANVRIEPSAEMGQWKGEMAFKVLPKEGPGAPLWVRARVRWFRPAWIASRQMGAADTLDPALFTEGRVETTNFREEPVSATREELGAILKSSRIRRTLAANAPLLPSTLERRPDAQAGAPLRVVFISESGVRVSADGALVGAGSIGTDVKAKLRASRKIVTGKLVSTGVVEVSL